MVYQHYHQSDEVIVAEPNRSASWQVNKMVLIAMCCLSGLIAGGFALMGAWPILPFAGLEMAALGSALYYVCWKLRYRHVVTLEADNVLIQKGHYHPRQQWRFDRQSTTVQVATKPHPWDAPKISFCNRGEQVSLGEFLNKEDTDKLLELLRDKFRVQSPTATGHRDF
ncbi:MAG: DUF2244 domain-containing protein [Halioglobus sp.]|nr:DUF2244 domain-containing protein [Halioglobus sp.]